MGAGGVEFDVRCLAGGMLVVGHDCEEETAGDLEPYLKVVASADLLVVFDWKGSGGEEVAAEMLAREGLLDRTLVSCEDVVALRRFKRARPTLATALSVERADQAEGAGQPDVDAIMLEHRAAEGHVVAGIRRAGLGLFFWTVNDPWRFAELESLAPDGVCTDRLGVLRGWCQGHGWHP